jgi:diguanylate cyclase (GGDEF)-like protein/PAS domain S-box-containing protein
MSTKDSWLKVLDLLADAVVILHPEGEILHANPAGLTLLGGALHQVIGRPLTAFLDPPDHEALRRALRHGLAGQTLPPLPLRLADADMTAQLHRLETAAGAAPALALFLRPADQDTMRLLASIVEGSQDAILTKTLDGTITSWNSAAEALFGYSADQAIGRSVTMLFPLERIAEENEIIARIRRGDMVRHYEATRIARDGRVLDLSVTVSPIRNAEGRVIGASKIARDMGPERARAERLTVLASVYQNCGEAIMILNAKGEFVEVNSGFTAITGFTEAEMVGRSFNAFRSGRQSPHEARRMIRELRRNRIAKGEIWTRRKDGSALAGFLTITALPCASHDNRYIAILADVTSLRLQQETLERLAHYDDLTGLPNRLLMHERLDRALGQALATDSEVSVAYLDIDGFKAVNDRHGHDAGDEILTALAQRMTACLAASDTVARIGGDEFVVILPQARGRPRRTEVLDRLLARIRQPIRRAGLEIRVAASIGVATFPQDQGGGEQIIRLADQAMFEAKKQGGNQIRHFDSARQEREIGQRRLVGEIETALTEGQFELHFQPKVHLATGAIVGAEALLRWVHPAGLRLPGAFLTQVLDHPVIEEIGAFVIVDALKAIRSLQAGGLTLPISINVTARDLRRPNFATYLHRQAQRFGLKDHALLQLELLETAALDDDPQIARTIDRCHRDGFRLAIDDFGVGFASLSYLGRIPADTIKLDRSFVTHIATDAPSRKIASAVLAMATAFGKQVVAEGVETPGAARQLLALGCEVAQGFCIAPPMPLTHFQAWAVEWHMRVAGLSGSFVDSPLLV